MKNILIDIRYLEVKHTGIAVGLNAFLKELDKINIDEFKIYLLYKDKCEFISSKFIPIQIDSKLFSMREHFELYKIFKSYNIDIFYSHHFVSPIFRTKKLKTINIIHDLIPLHVDVLSFLGKIYYYLMNFYTIKRSDIIVANSYSTKKDIKMFFKREDVKVVYHSFDQEKLQNFDDEILKKLGLEDKKYFLFVSSLKKHKNYHKVIEAFKKLNDNDIFLVFVGKKNNKLNIKSKNIIFTDYIADCELNSLYKNSKGLLFPSLIEGFGVPILEAWYHGIPVITSNISSMKEIATNGAILVNPYSVNDIYNAILKLQDKNIVEQLIENGRKNIKRFSWKKYTTEIIKIFKELK